MCSCLMSTPPSVSAAALPRAGFGQAYRPRSRETIVDLPEPELPTSATQLLPGIVREMRFRTLVSGRPG